MIILDNIYQQLVQLAQDGAPLEVCGYLAGDGERITDFVPITNAARSTRRYRFMVIEQFDAIREFRKKGIEVMAVYHSHPKGKPVPSDEDIELAADPSVYHFIIALNETAECGLFSIENEISTPVAFAIESES